MLPRQLRVGTFSRDGGVVASGGGGGPSAPGALAAPSFTGTMTDGQTLTAVDGTFTGSPAITRQFFSDGVAVPGATGATWNSATYGSTLISLGNTADYGGGIFVTSLSTQRYLFTNEDARVLVTRMTGEPPNYWKAAYDGAYSTANFATALADCDQFWYKGHDQQAGTIDWAHASRVLTVNGVMNWTEDGWASDASTGFLGSGVTHNAAAKLTLNSAAIFAGVAAGNNGANLNYLVGLSGHDTLRLAAGSTGDTANCRVNDGTTMTGANGNDVLGFFVGRRTASNSKELRRDGVDLTAALTTASTALSASTITYFKSNVSFLPASTILDMGGFGLGISDAHETALMTARTTLNTLSTPRHFIARMSGQSLHNRMFDDDTSSNGGGSGDGTVGSNSIDRVFKPELQAYLDAQYTDGRPNILHVLNVSVSGALLDSATESSWWNNTLNGGIGGAGAYAINANADLQDLIDSLGGIGNVFAIVEVWSIQNVGQLSQANYIKAFCGPAYDTGLIAYLRTVSGAGAKLVDVPVGRNSGNSDILTKEMRDNHATVAANVANCILSAETADTVRVASADYHPVSVDVSIHGFDRLTKTEARAVAEAFGCTSVVYKGPECASAAIVNGTTTTVTLTYPADAGGTDFTPTTGIEGFKVYDDGVSRAISAAVRTNATTITLTHAAVTGTRTVQFEATQGALNRDNMVRDNFGAIAMPLRMSALLTAV